MAKHTFHTEFEVRASKKVLYPYLSTASGLTQWFADNCDINEDKIFVFFYDGEEHRAKLVSSKANAHVKFQFLPETTADEKDPAYFEIKLEMSDLTQTLFVRITDHNESDDDQELQEMWETLIHDLKEIVGG